MVPQRRQAPQTEARPALSPASSGPLEKGATPPLRHIGTGSTQCRPELRGVEVVELPCGHEGLKDFPIGLLGACEREQQQRGPPVADTARLGAAFNPNNPLLVTVLERNLEVLRVRVAESLDLHGGSRGQGPGAPTP